MSRAAGHRRCRQLPEARDSNCALVRILRYAPWTGSKGCGKQAGVHAAVRKAWNLVELVMTGAGHGDSTRVAAEAAAHKSDSGDDGNRTPQAGLRVDE
jgi:hypothetical protein